MRFILLLFVVLASHSAKADEFDVVSFKTLDEGEVIRVHPAVSRPLFGRAYAAFRSGKLGFEESLRRILAAKTGSGVTLQDRSRHPGETKNFKFFVEDVPVCGYQVRAAELQGRGMLALGKAPRLKQVTPTALGDWPQKERVLDVAASQLEALLDLNGAVTESDAERCYVVRDRGLLPAWKFQLMADGRPYVALADEGEVYRIDRQFFEVDGNAKVYPENKVVTPTLTDIALPGLTGTNKLETEFLKTTVESGYTQASETSHDFTYPEGDQRFAEVSTFAHALAHFQFFTDLGFVYYDAKKPLLLEVHKAPGGSQNNALFTPAAGESAPKITIGNGDGVTLDNLTLDGDVVSHELGHLVIFQYLTTTSGPSLVLHEGLADFFAFAQSGNACLGESICPVGSGACAVPGQCLRSGELEVKYGDDQWDGWAGGQGKLGHLHGQVISGMLWDLRKTAAMPPDVLTKTVFKALSYLPETASFSDFMDSLLIANNQISGTKYDAAIRKAVTDRGMAEFLPDGLPTPPTADDDDDEVLDGKVPDAVSPVQDPIKTPSPEAPAPDDGSSESKKKPKKKVLGVGCGVVRSSQEKAPGFAGAWMILCLGLPISLALTSARASSSRGRKA